MDNRIGTIHSDGSYTYPSLTADGLPYNRGGGFSTCRLDATHFVVYVGHAPDLAALGLKPETRKETVIRGKPKREDDSENDNG